MARREQHKVIRDPIHDYVQIPVEIVPVVQLPHVQRLRYISQTANVRMAYPSLNGSRYEHALGTMHLAVRAWEAGWANIVGHQNEDPFAAKYRFRHQILTEIRSVDPETLDPFTRSFLATQNSGDEEATGGSTPALTSLLGMSSHCSGFCMTWVTPRSHIS